VSQIAAALGHLHVLEWVLDNTVGWPDMPLRARLNSGMSVWFQAVIGGQVHVLQWAFAKGWICRDRHGATDLFEAAVRAGQVNVLDWIRTVCPTVTPDGRTWIRACEYHQLVSMAWIRRQFPACHAPRSVWHRACDLERRRARGQMIQWLRDNFEHHPI
jgi:hypothetical protein